MDPLYHSWLQEKCRICKQLWYRVTITLHTPRSPFGPTSVPWEVKTSVGHWLVEKISSKDDISPLIHTRVPLKNKNTIFTIIKILANYNKALLSSDKCKCSQSNFHICLGGIFIEKYFVILLLWCWLLFSLIIKPWKLWNF